MCRKVLRIFTWVTDKSIETYHKWVILEDLIIYIGGIFTGIFLGLLLISWITRVSIRDKDLPEVEVMKIKRGDNQLFVYNPKGLGDVIHSLFVMIGWKLKLIKKSSVYFQNPKISKFIAYTICVFAIIVMIISLILIFVIVGIDVHTQ